MTRTTRYKLFYMLAFTLLGVVAVLAIANATLRHRTLVAVGIALVLLIPGRITGHFWRDFFRGRRRMRMGRWEESIADFESFLDQVRRRPWTKRLIWFVYGVYTRDIEAMSLNNLGVAHLQFGRLDEAERILKEAVALDPLNPLPPFNLACIAHARGDEAAAAAYLTEASRLGYNRTAIDRVVHLSGELLAEVEGRPLRH